MTLWNGVEATDEQQKKVLWIVMGQNQNRPFGPLSIQFTNYVLLQTSMGSGWHCCGRGESLNDGLTFTVAICS